jgi:hypothetical protein
MDLVPRLSAQQQQYRAARFRTLAANATTPRAKAYLLAQAGHCDALAAGRIDLTSDDDDEPDQTAGTSR